MEKRVEAMNREQPFDTDEQPCMLKIQREVRGTRLKTHLAGGGGTPSGTSTCPPTTGRGTAAVRLMAARYVCKYKYTYTGTR